MHSSWLKAGAGQNIMALSHDRRPAWLWVSEDDSPIWTNDSAQLASIAACGDADCLRPIAGQVKRLLRLGTINLPLVARIPFIAGSKPDSISCMCTPIELPNGNKALLVVAQKKIKKHQFAERETLDPQVFAFLPTNVSYVLADSSERILGGAGQALELAQQDNLVEGVSWDTETLDNGIRLFLLKSDHDLDGADQAAAMDTSESSQLSDDASDSATILDAPSEQGPTRGQNSLSELITLMDSSSSLYDPLGPEDDELPPEFVGLAQPPTQRFEADFEDEDQLVQASDDPDEQETAPENDDDIDSDEPQVWRVMGKGPVKTDSSVATGSSAGMATNQFVGFNTLSPEHADATIYTGQGPYGAPISTKTDDDDFATTLAGEVPEETQETSEGTQGADASLLAEAVVSPTGQSNEQDSESDEWSDYDDLSALAEQEDVADLEKMDGVFGIASEQQTEDDNLEDDLGGNVDDDPRLFDDAASISAESDLADSENPTATSQDSIDRTARYNFDELSKILNERVKGGNLSGGSLTSGGKTQGLSSTGSSAEPTKNQAELNAPLPLDHDLILLNRLPVGVLIFRDQDVLFANRTFADMLACASITQVRELGLGRIFPQMVESDEHAGPILQLRNVDDEAVWVDARLQSISFQSEPALVLTAHTSTREAQEPDVDETKAERLAATFDVVSALANLRSEGLAQLNAAGVISEINENGCKLIQHPERSIVGRPLALFVRQTDAESLGDQLAQTQDAGETAQTSIESQVLPLDMIGGSKAYLISLKGRDGPAHLALLAKSERREIAPPGGHDPALMQRLGRSIRRPLNTIMGFSQLIEGQTFGDIENDRYLGYARGILESGREIVGLIDELEDFSHLESGNFRPTGESFNLVEMLEECESVVRHQAGVRQVLVRSAIADDLPNIRADRSTLRKAMLNVLASAIDQSSAGGKIILAAQLEDDGSIGVHVRDSGTPTDDWADRFAVFREQSGKGPEAMIPLKSSMGLALTRSLFAINSCELSLAPTSGTGSLITVNFPQKLIVVS